MKGHPTLEVPVTCLAVSPYVDRYLPLLTTRRSPEDFPILPPVGKVFGSQLEVPPTVSCRVLRVKTAVKTALNPARWTVTCPKVQTE
nr:MAG TPA: hypothetical protein [Siphoviridae sp. ctX8T1]